MLAKSDRSGTNVTSAAELDTLFCAFDVDWLFVLDGSEILVRACENLPDSERADRSLQMRWSSAEGRVMEAA